ncbi:hypothetical protein M9H77_02126 [Catharanthus roseus]|uniref:Uncharacterized protein n=1 Tax=Catharanthus roseus TaxID=4058 RepID=A0ACC0C7H4_CATRO|nr:hypothetical protein M9H77_02126 [Catharanthus roseus]
METSEKTTTIPFANVEVFNCDVINHSECIGDDFMLMECLEEEVTIVVETLIEDSLVGSVVSSEEAFKLYNDHAFKLGFSVRKGNQKFKTRLPIVSEWRSNANMEDFRYKEGFVKMMVTKSKLLKHANEFGDLGKVSKKDIAGYSAWRREMLRKFSDLISARELNINAQEYVEEGLGY